MMTMPNKQKKVNILASISFILVKYALVRRPQQHINHPQPELALQPQNDDFKQTRTPARLRHAPQTKSIISPHIHGNNTSTPIRKIHSS